MHMYARRLYVLLEQRLYTSLDRGFTSYIDSTVYT